MMTRSKMTIYYVKHLNRLENCILSLTVCTINKNLVEGGNFRCSVNENTYLLFQKRCDNTVYLHMSAYAPPKTHNGEYDEETHTNLIEYAIN